MSARQELGKYTTGVEEVSRGSHNPIRAKASSSQRPIDSHPTQTLTCRDHMQNFLTTMGTRFDCQRERNVEDEAKEGMRLYKEYVKEHKKGTGETKALQEYFAWRSKIYTGDGQNPSVQRKFEELYEAYTSSQASGLPHEASPTHHGGMDLASH